MTLRERLINYSNDIISNKIVSCKKHKWACMRFLRDIDRENTDEFPFVFDEKKANRFFAWARLFKHTKGKLAGQYIEPDTIHLFIFGNIYGWINRNSGYRRFNKLYWQIARKNSKSQWASLVASFECFAFDERGVEQFEVYCAATKLKQAQIVYKEIVTMLNNCQLLKGKYLISYGMIVHKKTGSFITCLSQDDKKKGDGPNPQCGIIDEVHQHETTEIEDSIETGMNARMQPLLLKITTAGINLDVPCYRIEYDLVTKILDPNVAIALENYFVMINEVDICELEKENETIDDPIQKIKNEIIKNPSLLFKSNPIVCSYPEGVESLNKKLAEAIAAPEKMTTFLTKYANIWVHARPESFMDMGKWSQCKNIIPNLSGQYCVIGGDMSAKLDMTSLAFEFKIDDTYYIFSHSFIPEDTLQAKMQTDKMPYDMWVEQGFITLVSGAVIDYMAMMEYAIEITDKKNWRRLEWALDPWGTTQLSHRLIERGETVVEVIQGYKTLSEPTKNFKEETYRKKIMHDGNPVLTWAISNAVKRIDYNKNEQLDKSKSTKRIDPIAAAINAHSRAIVSDFVVAEPMVLSC